MPGTRTAPHPPDLPRSANRLLRAVLGEDLYPGFGFNKYNNFTVDVESDTLNYNSLESGTCPYFPSETFVEAMEQATNIGAVKSWLNNEGVKLNPARWELWGSKPRVLLVN